MSEPYPPVAPPPEHIEVARAIYAKHHAALGDHGRAYIYAAKELRNTFQIGLQISAQWAKHLRSEVVPAEQPQESPADPVAALVSAAKTSVVVLRERGDFDRARYLEAVIEFFTKGG